MLKLPDFQKEQAVIGAKNYAKRYKTENPDDSIGKFTINAINFIIGDKETFDDFQEEIKLKKKTLGGFI